MDSRLIFCTLSPVFYMHRTAGRGKIVRKTLKTHISHHFMPLGVLLSSFILITIHVLLRKCQWNSIQICGTVFCSHCGEKKAFNCRICKVNRVLCVKTWFVSFVLMSAHKQIHFLRYSMYISDMNFLFFSLSHH